MSVSVDDATATEKGQWNRYRLPVALAILILEAILLVYVYRFDMTGLVLLPPLETNFCNQILTSVVLCDTLARLPPLIMLLFIIVGFLLVLHPQPGRLGRIKHALASYNQPHVWLIVNAVGCALIIIPYLMALNNASAATMAFYGPMLWGVGCLAFTFGLALWVMPAADILNLLNWKIIAGILFLLALPQMHVFIGNTLWVESALQQATLDMSIVFLKLFGQPILWDGGINLGIKDFVVAVGFACAGLSGIAFSSSAVFGYILWMRSQLHVGRALAMVPLIALLSWTFNAFRIAVLIIIGEYVSPVLAIEGFHSYAGWISFTFLTGAMVLAVDRTPWFQKTSRERQAGTATPILADTRSAQILPFAVFLFSSLLIGAFFEVPAEGYPVRIALTVGCLLLFWRCLPADLNWRIDPIAVISGVAIAVMWLMGQSGPKEAAIDVVPNLIGSALTVWVIIRVFGTSVVVPVVEELFFRGYLMKRLNIGGPYSVVIGLLASSALFAALHGNLILAFIAGVIFGALVLRSGRVMDAVYSHAVANFLIAAFALLTDNWAVI